jgi:hypothetical protein
MSLSIFEEKIRIQSAISSYIGDMMMVKIKQTQATSTKPSYSLYYAKVGCLLCVEDRYIIAVIESDPYPIGSQEPLSHMNWVSFQTRTLEKPPARMKSQETRPVLTKILNEKIHITEKKVDRSVYGVNSLPLKVELLYTKEDESYCDNGTIQSAVDTYNCVLSFTI